MVTLQRMILQPRARRLLELCAVLEGSLGFLGQRVQVSSPALGSWSFPDFPPLSSIVCVRSMSTSSRYCTRLGVAAANLALRPSKKMDDLLSQSRKDRLGGDKGISSRCPWLAVGSWKFRRGGRARRGALGA